MKIEKMIKAALTNGQCELVLKNANIVNVFTGEIVRGDIAIDNGIIVGVGSYSGKTEKDIVGKYVVPGFINSHVHVESSMAAPEVYAMEELRQGTTTIITDPHEIANVGGMTAIAEILKAARRTPINYFVMLPSCVPATPFEHSGAVLEARELSYFKNDPNVLGLGEMMNAVGVLSCDKNIIEKLNNFSDKVIDGHFPMGAGKELDAYICAGIDTDHESISYTEAVTKLRAGMAVLVREGSASRNLDSIISGVVKSGIDTSRLAFCTDDKHLADIRRDGTIRYNIKRSAGLGLDPIKAIQMATINAANIYHLRDIGAVAVGYKADLVVLDNLKDFDIISIYKDGKNIEELDKPKAFKYSSQLLSRVNFAPLSPDTFTIPEQDLHYVIGIVNKQIITQKLIFSEAEIKEGIHDGTIKKIAVIERHNATGNSGVGYIHGYGNIHGAVASTVAHDSHNIVVVGDNDRDMFLACEELKRIGGGYVITGGGKVIGSLSLPLGGLMSLSPADELISDLESIIRKAYKLGVNPEIDPFITLSFMALPVIPEIRITDRGIFDVTRFEFVNNRPQ